MKTKFGTDPEFFAVDTNKESPYPYIVPPAALIMDGNMPYVEKHTVTADGRPKIVKVIHAEDTFSIIEDGAAFEINIEPTSEINVFGIRLNTAKKKLKELLEPYGLGLMDDIVGFFDVSNFWDGRGAEFKDCVTFGCDPDRSLYRDLHTEKGNKPLELEEGGEVDVSTYPYRFGGGHLHIGVPNYWLGDGNLLSTTCYGISYMFDALVHTRNVVLHEGDNEAIEKELVRLEHYGSPGRFRLQPHGFEYRPLSNWWLREASTRKEILEVAEKIVWYIRNGGERSIDLFMNRFFDNRKELYSALKSFDMDYCNSFHNEAMSQIRRYV